VVNKVMEAMNSQGKSVKSSRILVLGLAYKKDVDDTRESPSFKLMELLMERGAHVDFSDPYIPKTRKMRIYNFNKTSVALTKENLKTYDCVLIATDHSTFDYSFIAANSTLIVDTRNATGSLAGQPPSKKQAVIVKA